MKKAALIFLAAASAVAGLLAAGLAVLWWFPGAFVNAAARAAQSKGIELRAADVRGTPATGWPATSVTRS